MKRISDVATAAGRFDIQRRSAIMSSNASVSPNHGGKARSVRYLFGVAGGQTCFGLRAGP